MASIPCDWVWVDGWRGREIVWEDRNAMGLCWVATIVATNARRSDCGGRRLHSVVMESMSRLPSSPNWFSVPIPYCAAISITQRAHRSKVVKGFSHCSFATVQFALQAVPTYICQVNVWMPQQYEHGCPVCSRVGSNNLRAQDL